MIVEEGLVLIQVELAAQHFVPLCYTSAHNLCHYMREKTECVVSRTRVRTLA